jgi:hypothetical protein
MHHFALTDQSGREFRCPAALTRGTAQYKGIAAVFDDGFRRALAVEPRYLSDGLEAENATTAKFPQSCESVFKAVYSAQRVKFIDYEPQPLITFVAIHRFEDAQSHPGGDEASQGGYLGRFVGQEQ